VYELDVAPDRCCRIDLRNGHITASGSFGGRITWQPPHSGDLAVSRDRGTYPVLEARSPLRRDTDE